WLYGLYELGGFGLVVLWKAVVMTAICGLVGVVAARRTGPWLWGVPAAMMTAWLGTAFAAGRPPLLAFLFVALFIAVLGLSWARGLVPVISLIWANCHGGFFLGWIVCAAYLSRRTRWYCLAAVAISGLNPNGFRVLETLLLYRQSALQSTLIEWSKPYLWG